MRKQFLGYYPPSEDELESLWGDGLLILDTNALLNLFRYTPSTRDDFLSVLQSERDRLWLPHQVALEFHRRRLEVIEQQSAAFTEVEAALTAAESSVSKVLQKFKRHPSLDVSTFGKEVETHLSVLSDRVSESRKVHEKSILNEGGYEATFGKITELFEDRVGEEFAEESLAALYKEGAERYEVKRPPGFKDIDKPEPARYGDFILWKQILNHASEQSLPAIFVTDDAKDDWWYKVNGRTQGARIELVDEYLRAAGQRIHFYSPERFLAFANGRGTSAVKSESLSEVEEVSTQRASRVREQLIMRRGELEQERDRLMRQMRAAAGPAAFDLRRTRDAQEAIEGLHHQLHQALEKQQEIRSGLSDEGEDREQLLYALGRLDADISALHQEIEKRTASYDRLQRVLSRRSGPEHLQQLEERLNLISDQAGDVEVVLQDLDSDPSL